jgi:hypothetical protein
MGGPNFGFPERALEAVKNSTVNKALGFAYWQDQELLSLVKT